MTRWSCPSWRAYPRRRRRHARRPHAGRRSAATRSGCAAMAQASGLHVVMGTRLVSEAYYPAEALIDRRSVDDLADELVAGIEGGVDGTDVRPGIIGEIGTDKPWLTALEERVHRAVGRRRPADRPGDHDPLGDVAGRARPAAGLRGRGRRSGPGRDRPRRLVPRPRALPRDHRRGANIEFDFLGMSFTPMERHGEPRIVDLARELIERGHADRCSCQPGRLPQQPAARYGGNGYVHLFTDVPAPAAGGRGARGGDPPDDGAEPRAGSWRPSDARSIGWDAVRTRDLAQDLVRMSLPAALLAGSVLIEVRSPARRRPPSTTRDLPEAD